MSEQSTADTPSEKKKEKESHFLALLFTGKQKSVEAVSQWLKAEQGKGALEIITQRQDHKSKWMRQYEEVRFLLKVADPLFDLPSDLADALDAHQTTNKATVTLGVISPRVIDSWLKWNIREHLAQFELSGGSLEITEKKERQDNGAVWRICHYSLTGPLGLALRYREKLENEKLADPTSYTYQF